MIYKTFLEVRSYECDSYNHVNNAVYLNYLEAARMDFMNQINFDYKGIVAAGYALYVTHIDIHYKTSAFLCDKLVIETESTKLGAVKGAFHQEIKKEDGTVCAVADVTWACVKTGGIPAKIPQEFIVEGLKPQN
jgi:acyl-CoA thioester hydrolase